MPATNRWTHLTDDELASLVREHRVSTKFCSANQLPHYKTVLRRLNFSKWSDLLESLDIGKNPVGPKKDSNHALFYLLRCLDDDGIYFVKYGTTRGSLGSRYKAYVDQYEVILNVKVDVDIAGRLERFCDKLIEYKYEPKSINFQAGRHGGFSECLNTTSIPLILKEVLDYGQF